MKTLIVSVVLLLMAGVANIYGQNIAFEYDADGNLENRYVVPLPSLASKNITEEETTTDIVEIKASEYKIKIYPNPTKGRLVIEITPLDAEVKNFLRLFSRNGSLIYTQDITTTRTELVIDGNAGIYLLNIYLGEVVSKWKIIKQ
jgi:hypothetical protein